jgi:formylglycine-generating enzyme required for sulfatase activity/energy-coupling factor transporter ATP-binding protein EcfA2
VNKKDAAVTADRRAELQSQIESLQTAIAALHALPADRAPLERNLAARQADLATLDAVAGPTISSVSAGRDVFIATTLIIQQTDPEERQIRTGLFRAYLNTLAAECNRLSLADADSSDPNKAAVQLATVYVGLETARQVKMTAEVYNNSLKIERERQLTVLEALAQQPTLVLLGAPGSGKSTLLNFVGLCLAHANRGEVAWLDRLGTAWSHGALLPIRALLREFAAWVSAQQPRPPRGDAALFWRWLATMHDAAVVPLLRAAFGAGHALLLLDGLDEVPRDRSGFPLTLVRDTIQALAAAAGGSRLAVTCRVLDYDRPERQLNPWPSERVIDLSDELRTTFVETWFTALTALDRARPEQADQRRDGLVAQIRSRAELRRLAGNPLLLTMMTLLQAYKGPLPDTRVELYEQCLDWLIDKWRPEQRTRTLAETLELPDWRSDDLNSLLDRLGHTAHQRGVSGDGEQGTDLPDTVLIETAAAFFQTFDAERKRELAERFCSYIDRHSNGVLQRVDENRYRFPHRTFQEYLAARRLTSEGGWEAGEAEYDRRALVRADAGPQWREVLLLATSRQITVLKQASPALALVERLQQRHRAPGADWAHDQILAAEILNEIGLRRLEQFAAHKLPLRQQAVDALRRVLDAGAQEFAARARAGTALGELGDPRYPVTLAQWQAEWASRNEIFGQPAGYFCYVPGGTYTIGGWEDGEQSVDLTLAPFWIGRLPVTVAQYTAFVDDPRGYRADRWWTAAGLQWRGEGTAPKYWDDPRFNNANQPVVGVSWYEARAYCAWSGAQLGADVRLPTEAEWEAAAAFAGPTVRREYPWGDQPEPTLAHAVYDAAKLAALAPVGCCPAGAAACGALDMVGNVWEWCTSRYEAYPGGAAYREEDFTDQDFDVPLRGGTAWDDSTSVRCGARNWIIPTYGDFDFGFRVVVSLVRT